MLSNYKGILLNETKLYNMNTLDSAVNLGGAGVRPTAPRCLKNLMGPRPIAPRSQDRPCIFNIRKFVRAETGKNATLQLIIYIHRLKFAGDEIGRTATIVDNIYIYIYTNCK